jgi:uracil-DNA glycosylase
VRWTERQRAMLGEMGIRLWPEAPESTGSDVETVEAQAAEVQAASPAPIVAQAVAPITMRAVTSAPGRAGEGRLAPSAPAPARVADSAAAGQPAAGIVATMDWSELRATVANCTACRLCQGRTQTVFGVGNPQADWMIVGEAPGEQEDRQGEPFVGKSGQLLDNMLRAVGLTRQDAPAPKQVYIANTIKCRPPGNRNPQPDELAQCEPFLVRQVALVRPKIIVAMGRFAVQSLLRSTEPIGRLRGRVHDYHGVPLIVTYHPAYLLRSLEEKARAWDDLCLAVETVNGR